MSKKGMRFWKKKVRVGITATLRGGTMLIGADEKTFPTDKTTD